MKRTLLAAVLLTGCIQSTNPTEAKAVNDITFMKEPHTGLCFAMLNSKTSGGYQVVSMASVSCDVLGVPMGVR